MSLVVIPRPAMPVYPALLARGAIMITMAVPLDAKSPAYVATRSVIPARVVGVQATVVRLSRHAIKTTSVNQIMEKQQEHVHRIAVR